MKRLVLLAVFSLGLSLLSASASRAATGEVKFKPYTFGYVRDGFLGAVRPRNRILIGRTRAQALRWDRSIWHSYTSAPQAGNFVTGALIGVFLLDRRPSPPFPQQPRPPDVGGVVVTSLAVSNGTLSLTLKVSPYPIVLHGPGPDSPDEYFQLPGAPSGRYHAFTLVSLAKATVAQVRRVVVTEEVYDPDPLVVDVPSLPL